MKRAAVLLAVVAISIVGCLAEPDEPAGGTPAKPPSSHPVLLAARLVDGSGPSTGDSDLIYARLVDGSGHPIGDSVLLYPLITHTGNLAIKGRLDWAGPAESLPAVRVSLRRMDGSLLAPLYFSEVRMDGENMTIPLGLWAMADIMPTLVGDVLLEWNFGRKVDDEWHSISTQSIPMRIVDDRPRIFNLRPADGEDSLLSSKICLEWDVVSPSIMRLPAGPITVQLAASDEAGASAGIALPTEMNIAPRTTTHSGPVCFVQSNSSSGEQLEVSASIPLVTTASRWIPIKRLGVVGTWNRRYTLPGATSADKEWYAFRSDSSFVTWSGENLLDGDSLYTATGTWSVSGDSLTLTSTRCRMLSVQGADSVVACGLPSKYKFRLSAGALTLFNPDGSWPDGKVYLRQ